MIMYKFEKKCLHTFLNGYLKMQDICFFHTKNLQVHLNNRKFFHENTIMFACSKISPRKIITERKKLFLPKHLRGRNMNSIPKLCCSKMPGKHSLFTICLSCHGYILNSL